jgi:serine/threonine-protein kinase
MNTVEPSRFGRYEVIEEIGRGAMGLVYKAADPTLNRLVAIKSINLHLDQDERAGYEERFAQEAKAAGSLNHPNIVTIYDLGSASDLVYIAMEFLDGRDLAALIKSLRRLPIALATRVVIQLADALGHAHEKGIIHRDIKPANIMVLRDDRVKLTDFGIARLRSQESRTQTGMRLGSPLYMSPEQVLGHRSDPRSDIFSLGAVFYEMLTGHPPFGGSSLESIMYQTINIAPTIPSRVRPEVPEILDLVVARMLEKAPENRYQSAWTLADDLRECRKFFASSGVDANGNPWYADPPVDLLDLPAAAAPTDPGAGVPDEASGPLPDDDVSPVAPLAVLGNGRPAAIAVSREFDSFAATQKLVSGLNSPFDRPPVFPLGDTTMIDDAAGTLPLPTQPPATRRWWRLSRREWRVSGAIVGGAALAGALIIAL